MEKHDEEILRIGSTDARIEDLYKQIQDSKLRFYNSLKSSQLTKDEYQRKLDSIHRTETECLFQLYQLLLNYVEDEKLGLEDKIERMKEVVKLWKDFKAEGIDVGIDLAEAEEVVKMHQEFKVLKSAAQENPCQELLDKLDKFHSKCQHSFGHKQPSISN
ncbi:hypothetical protein A2U01_0014299 [Trifolium medium]|uniref:Uncharacterized protein n=1 Tax=Trifolium medium TaxID=97028 RepID=A0A392N0M1_9FABA|nr:hypothetical protein [Trifolium medium]